MDYPEVNTARGVLNLREWLVGSRELKHGNEWGEKSQKQIEGFSGGCRGTQDKDANAQRTSL